MIVKINNNILQPSEKDFSFYNPLNYFDGTIKEWARENSQEFFIGVLQGLGDILFDMSYAIALLGGGICVLLWVAGWRDGSRWASILVVASVIIRGLFS